jgi:NDP-sugar pyrophosphorylase family protein
VKRSGDSGLDGSRREERALRIARFRATLLEFIRGDARRIEIEIDCPVEDRIGFIYSAVFPGLAKYRFYLAFAIARLAGAIDWSPLKVALYRSIGMKIGTGAFISPGVVLDPHFPSLIEIGDYAIIGWGTQLFTHEFTGSRYILGRIRIGRGAVIGGLSIVRGGVTVGANAQVASACIVYKDVPDNYCIDSVILLSRALVDVYRREIGG